MNRLEFNEIMKAAGINNPLSTTIGRYGSSENVHYWNNLAIYFSGSYYAVVRGRIPLEVANIIYEKYPNNPFQIRVGGGCDDWIPFDYATDEKYEEDIQEYSSQHLAVDEYLAKCKNARRNLRRRNDNNKYIKTYHIDTKEGLLIFLNEMKDYYLRKSNMPETEVRKYDEIISKVSFEILKKVNPSISAYDWMQNDKKNKDNYNFSIERDSKTKMGQMFRTAILDFDKAVNPFINDDFEIDEINNYLKNVKINANLYDSIDGKYRKDCCHLEIVDFNTGNSTNYYRNPDGFSFQLMYRLDDKQYLNVSHYYSAIGNYESDKGEIISINYFGNNTLNEIDIRLNLTNGKAGATYDDKIPATLEQINFVYEELLKATNYASEVTVKNMKKKGISKQLSFNG